MILMWPTRSSQRRIAATLIGVLLSSLLAACGITRSNDGGLQIAASFYPLAFVAQRIAGERAEVMNLTTPGTEPHDLELGFLETASVAEADLVVYQRGFQPAVDETVDAVVEDALVVDLTETVDIRPDDPHFWLDPLLLAQAGDQLAAALGDLDTERSVEYAARAAQLRAELVTLDESYHANLGHCARSTVVVSHDAFGYLDRYGLTFEAINGLSPDAEPTPATLARLHELAVKTGVTTVFSETLASPKLAQTLAADLGVVTAVLDPVEGLSDASAGDDYLDLMRANLAALRKANQC
jgi:zinc transport system substrate-binding protein